MVRNIIHSVLCHFWASKMRQNIFDRIELHEAPVARRPVIELLEVCDEFHGGNCGVAE